MRRQKLNGPYIIGFNGPPRVGKDTLGQALQNLLDDFTDTPVHRQALASTMRDGAAAILGMTGGDKWYNEIKDKPLEILDGKTFRDFMIATSELFVKQVYGKDFWARRMHYSNKAWWDTTPTILIVTDIGFSAEVEYFCNHSEGYLNVVLTRDRCDYALDSRSNVWSQGYGGTDFAYHNDATPEEGAKAVLEQAFKLGWPVL
jgi:hypothetical protein